MKYNGELFVKNCLAVSGCKHAKEFAKQTGFSEPTVSNWKTGTRIPSAKDFETIVNKYGCSIDYLLGNVPKEKASDILDAVESIASLEPESISINFFVEDEAHCSVKFTMSTDEPTYNLSELFEKLNRARQASKLFDDDVMKNAIHEIIKKCRDNLVQYEVTDVDVFSGKTFYGFKSIAKDDLPDFNN